MTAFSELKIHNTFSVDYDRHYDKHGRAGVIGNFSNAWDSRLSI